MSRAANEARRGAARSVRGGRILLAASAGTMLALSFPRPGWWWLLMPGLALVFALAASSPGRAAFAEGLTAGFAFNALLLRWFAAVIRDHTTLGPAVAVAAVLVSGLIVGLLVAALSWVVARIAARRGPGLALLVAPALWVALERVREWFPLPFPWGVLSAALARQTWAAEVASIVGSAGLALLVAATAAALAASALRVRAGVLALLASVAALAALAALGFVQSPASGSSLRASVLQASLPRDAAPATELQTYVDLTRQAAAAGAELIVWPESATPFRIDADADYRGILEREAAALGVDLVIGSVTADDGGRYFNSAALVRADTGLASVSSKRILVPFGEYVPLRAVLSRVPRLVEAPGDFSAGEETVVHEGRSASVGVLVCYESVFPGLAEGLADSGAGLLANMTNDSWFGRSAGPGQHLQHGMLRAAETGRPLLRAAHTGISAIVDRRGRLVGELGLGERGVLTADVAPATRGAPGAPAGRVLAAACVILAAVFLVDALRRWPRRR